jgi:hypothetical protein
MISLGGLAANAVVNLGTAAGTGAGTVGATLGDLAVNITAALGF